jgi:hypothetical protein
MKDSTFGIYFDLFCAFATPCSSDTPTMAAEVISMQV